MRKSWISGTVFVLLSAIASADTTNAPVEFELDTEWITSGEGLDGALRVTCSDCVSKISVAFAYSDSSAATIPAYVDGQNASIYHFSVPPASEAFVGELTLQAVLFYKDERPSVQSETLAIPVVHEQELDITGDAAIALLYPLGGDEYTVRYVPCCNIFGGITIATRVPVNPEESSEGLPEKILSDFLILSPDGLSASTMGMYMDFEFGPERFEGVTPALYEFNGREWVEFSTYEVDAARGYLSMHCPNGGTFVIAAKP